LGKQIVRLRGEAPLICRIEVFKGENNEGGRGKSWCGQKINLLNWQGGDHDDGKKQSLKLQLKATNN
jgi:hypothetical protein